jgi:hypothetical protein
MASKIVGVGRVVALNPVPTPTALLLLAPAPPALAVRRDCSPLAGLQAKLQVGCCWGCCGVGLDWARALRADREFLQANHWPC